MNSKRKNMGQPSQDLRRVAQCLYRSQQSGVYYAILKRSGKQIKRSLRTTDQALAKRRLADLSKRASALAHGKDSAITFDDLAKRWLVAVSSQMKASSRQRLEGCAQCLGQHFGLSQARRITKSMIEEWAAIRSKQRAARTFNYERETLVRILDYAVRDGLMLDNPALVIKRRKVRRKQLVIPTREQFLSLIQAIRQLRADALPAADLCELLAYSGCRLGEATAMQWKHIDFQGKRFTVTGGTTGPKNSEERVVPLFPSLESFLLRLRDNCAAPPRPEDRIAQIENAKTAMRHACSNAALPHFTHHHLRHFFCSNAIEAGVDFKAIAGWLGHKDGGLLVARTYGHLRDEHSATMAKRMTFELCSCGLAV
jgi:integrase